MSIDSSSSHRRATISWRTSGRVDAVPHVSAAVEKGPAHEGTWCGDRTAKRESRGREGGPEGGETSLWGSRAGAMGLAVEGRWRSRMTRTAEGSVVKASVAEAVELSMCSPVANLVALVDGVTGQSLHMETVAVGGCRWR